MTESAGLSRVQVLVVLIAGSVAAVVTALIGNPIASVPAACAGLLAAVLWMMPQRSLDPLARRKRIADQCDVLEHERHLRWRVFDVSANWLDALMKQMHANGLPLR